MSEPVARRFFEDIVLGCTAQLVGTHALFQEAVSFEDLALAVVDEQHRFGVAQREALGAKGISPHILLMTATPIPRTLGQILLADVDVSDLRTLPAGRLTVRTGIRRTKDLVGDPDDPARSGPPIGQAQRMSTVRPCAPRPPRSAPGRP